MSNSLATTTAGREATLLIRILSVAFIVAIAIGACMSYIFFFHEPYVQVTKLEAADLNLDQEIYREVVARVTRDMAEMQEQSRMQALLDADIAVRKAKHALLTQGLADDIQQRIDGDQDIADRLAQEIILRIDNDTLFQQRIDNATVIIVDLQEFETFSTEQFMIKMANITDITQEIQAEIAARLAQDMIFMTQDVIIDTALVLLVSQLNTESMQREAKDNLLRSQLNIVVYSLFHTINLQSPSGGDIEINSLSPSLVITNGPALDVISIAVAGIATFQGVGRNAAGNIQFVAGNGITIDSPFANTIRITGATGTVISSNYNRLAVVIPHGSANQYVNSMPGTFNRLRNVKMIVNLGTCSVPACVIAYGPGWACQSPIPGTVFDACINFVCADETNCNDVLGDPWHCRASVCVQDYCTEHMECWVAYNHYGNVMGGNAQCINHRCVAAGVTGDSLPGYVNNDYTPSTDVTTAYTPISQARNPATPAYCSGCLNPEPGYRFSFNVISTKPPFPAAQILQGTGCLFPTWFFQNCGFYLPSPSTTYIITMTVTIRIRMTNYNPSVGAKPAAWFRMFMDRGYGWEPIDSEFVGITDGAPFDANWFYSYVSMSSTVIMTSQPAGQIPVSRIIHVGWDAYKIASNENTGRPLSAAWWRVSYDLTQVA